MLANLVIRLTYASLPGFPLFGASRWGCSGSPRRSAGARCEPAAAEARTTRCSRWSPRGRAAGQGVVGGGAVVAGAWTGLLVFGAAGGAVSAAASGTAAALVRLVCALVLVGGALWLERCCRTPHPDGPDQRGDP